MTFHHFALIVPEHCDQAHHPYADDRRRRHNGSEWLRANEDGCRGEDGQERAEADEALRNDRRQAARASLRTELKQPDTEDVDDDAEHGERERGAQRGLRA